MEPLGSGSCRTNLRRVALILMRSADLQVRLRAFTCALEHDADLKVRAPRHERAWRPAVRREPQYKRCRCRFSMKSAMPGVQDCAMSRGSASALTAASEAREPIMLSVRS